MEKKVLVSLLVILSILNLYLFATTPTSFVELNEKRFSIEIADNSLERQKGLMFRENLCTECGMLFIFKEDQPLKFWMKNTPIPLDIIFINSKKEVIGIHHATPCKEEKCEIYSSKEDGKYVLEVNTNTFDESIIGKKAKIVV